ncbi:hypothetical protein [Fulvitalea axinellae]
MPVQRKIGYEFEGQWNVRDLNPGDITLERMEEERGAVMREREAKIRAKLATGAYQGVRDNVAYDMAAHALASAGEIGEKPLLGKNLAKKQVIYKEDGFTLEADASPSGGSNIEWVTEPLEGRQTASKTTGRIQKMVSLFNRSKDSEYVDLAPDFFRANGFNGFVPAERKIRMYPVQGEIGLQPQFTCGFSLEEFSRVLSYLNEREREGRGAIPRRILSAGTGEGSDPAEDLTLAISGVRGESLGALDETDFPELAGIGFDMELSWDLDQLLGNVAIASEDLEKDEPKEDVDALLPFWPARVRDKNAPLKALLALVAMYLIRGKNLPEGANSKAIAGGLLSRTDFGYNFELLPEEIKRKFRANPDLFVQMALRVARMEGESSVPLYANSVRYTEMGEPNLGGNISLKRGDWLRSMVLGEDLLNHRRDPKIHASLGALGRSADGLLVVEFRRIQGIVYENRLLETAMSYYDFYEKVKKRKGPLK